MSDHADLTGDAGAATPPWVYPYAPPLQSALGGVGQEHIGPATALWPTGQRSDAAQRADRYLTHTHTHPQRTRSALVAQATARYSQPGQTVFDPFTGVGTTLVEAVYAGRRAIGAEAEPRWVEVPVLNLAHAHRNGASQEGLVILGDARHLAPIPRRLRRSVDLIVTSPPAQLRPVRSVTRRSPLSNGELVDQLAIDLKLAMTSWIPLLRPGATIVLATRLLHRHEQTLGLTVPIASTAEWAGPDLIERVAALRTRVRDAQQRPRSLPQGRGHQRGRKAAGRPQVVHDDVLVYRVPPSCRWGLSS